MKLMALHGFCLGGGVDVVTDQEFDAPPNMAAQWIASGAAVLAPDAQPEPPSPEVVTTSAPKGQKGK
jgi:hypothetical protein